MLTIPLSLLIAHFIGDFILQNDWMALNKSKSWVALQAHAAMYTMTIAAWMFIFFWPYSRPTMLGWIVATFITHFITDAITSRITSKLWFVELKPAVFKWEEMKHYENKWTDFYHVTFKSTRHWFFVAIGADQLIHYVTLALTLRLLS